jgi:UDP-glucose 4-epimerase
MYQWYRYPVIVMRNFNTFGENQDVSGNAGVVSNFLVRALRGEPLVIHNRGEQTRDFQYVKDAVHAYMLAIEKRNDLAGEIFNIGTGKQVSIKELAEMVLRITDSPSTIVYQQGRAADLISLEADYSEINKKTGWKPRYSLEEGLRRTAKWYRRYIK